ncbi:MAG: carboxypeptidase-like regulatory domain-containing protein, partial [Flavobacterium sp.]|nr:carboxypeptidase-like regulatory domain-containing protein [Flavobacterium sp.]
MKHIIFLYLISCSLSAQIKGVVKDSISGEPIPFVNIWVENETIGTTSEADGTFFLQASKEKNIVISVLGYERKILKGSTISEVFLKPTTYDLREVVILNKKQSKKIEIGDIKNAIFQSF